MKYPIHEKTDPYITAFVFQPNETGSSLGPLIFLGETKPWLVLFPCTSSVSIFPEFRDIAWKVPSLEVWEYLLLDPIVVSRVIVDSVWLPWTTFPSFGFFRIVLSEPCSLEILSFEVSSDVADVLVIPQVFGMLPKLPPEDAPPPLSEDTLSLSSSLQAIIRDSGNSK